MSNVFDDWDNAFSGIGVESSGGSSESVSIKQLRGDLVAKRGVLKSLVDTQRSAEFSASSPADQSGVLARMGVVRSEVDELQVRLDRAEQRAKEVTDLIVKEVRARIAGDKRLGDAQRKVVATAAARMLKDTVSGGGLDNPHLYSDPVKIKEAANYMLRHGYGALYMGDSSGGVEMGSPGIGTASDDFMDVGEEELDPYEAEVQKHLDRFAAGDPSLNRSKSYGDVLREQRVGSGVVSTSE